MFEEVANHFNFAG